MSGFLDWKYINEEQTNQLEKTESAVEIKKLLINIFQIYHYNPKKQSILCNFHFFNYAFCKEKAFNARKISTFMSIMNEILLKDCLVNSPKKTLDCRFDLFQELLIKHSVERSPQSVKVFEPTEIEPIMEYAMESYFRKFRLYQYIFDTLFVVSIKQTNPNKIQTPKIPLPLSDGYLLETRIEPVTVEGVENIQLE